MTLTRDQRKLLSTYLDDHAAGAAGGLRLAKRLADNNADSKWGPRLAVVAEEVAEDDQTLDEVRDSLGVRSGFFSSAGLKRAVAIVGERVARLKPNDRLRAYSPLSRIVETEAMMAGVVGKYRLWDAIRHSEVHELSSIDHVDFDRLIQRAEGQLDVLEAFHQHGAGKAFGPPSTSSRSGGKKKKK